MAEIPAAPRRPGERPLLHLGLFVATLITTTYAGIGLVARDAAYVAGGWQVMLRDGLAYSLAFLSFLTTH